MVHFAESNERRAWIELGSTEVCARVTLAISPGPNLAVGRFSLPLGHSDFYVCITHLCTSQTFSSPISHFPQSNGILRLGVSSWPRNLVSP
jgi:hypothetical protein